MLMYRAPTAIAVVGVLVGLPALASRSKSPTALHRQQMVNCMNGNALRFRVLGLRE
jgi:hypothetical protein